VAFLHGIRDKAGRYILNQKIHNNSRSREFVNLDAARTIGVVFHHIDPENFGFIKNFVRKLEAEGKKVNAVGYIQKKEIPDFYLVRKGFDFFCLKDLNWYCRPDTPYIQEFLNREFDVLINLSLDRFFPLEYIYALSRARFKAGNRLDDWHYDDLSLDTGENRNIPYLIEHLTHYLSIINKKQ
jgi:hypothetical protein